MNDQDQSNIEQIEKRLATIQRSTRTLLPFFLPIHNKLRAKSKFYYNWHLTPYYKKIHYSALAVAIAFIFSLSFQRSLTPIVKAASSTCYWVGGTATWDASNVNSWASSSGGTPGTCDGGVVPGADDTVIFDSNSGTSATVTLGEAYSPTVLGITLNKADLILALGANTLTISADSSTTFTFTSGTVNGDNTGDDLVVSGGTSNTATFSGGTYGANVSVTSGNIYLNGAIFNGTTNSFNKTGTTQNVSNGGNTFSSASITTFYKSADAAWILAGSSGNAYGGDIIVENTGASSLYIAGNDSGDAVSTLASGKTVTVGLTHGFTAGNLVFYTFTQAATTAQTLTLTGTASIYFTTNATFNGGLTVTAPNIYLSGGTFNGATNVFEKTGTANNVGAGGNTFGSSSTTTFYNSSTGDWTLAGTTGNTYNGHIKVESTAAGYLRIAGDAAGDPVSTLADGKTITVGTDHGFTTGRLYFYGFVQAGSSTAQTLALTSAADVRFFGGTTFAGGLTVTAPNIYLNGATFNGTTNSFTKTGTSANVCDGGNTFGAGTSTTFTYNPASGNWRLANTTADTYTGNVTFTTASTGIIRIAYTGINTFGGNVTLTPGSGTITVGDSGGTAQFSSASTQTLSSGGVTIPILTHTGAGTLQLASALTSTTLTNSAGTLDLNGQNLSLTAAAAVTNDGTIKLQGKETLTNVNNLDVDTGTVVYTGDNTTNTYAIKDFGDTDYYNLSFTDANASKIKLQVADTKTLTVAGDLTLSSGSGTFDNATYDEAINVGTQADATSGDVTMDNTRTDMGDATWTVWGSFDNASVTTFNCNSSTLVMNGTGKQIISAYKTLNNLTIQDTVSISQPSGSSVGMVGLFSVSGPYSVESAANALVVTGTTSDVKITSNGSITGAGHLYLESGSKLTQKDGVINVAVLHIANTHTASYPILPATYESATVLVQNYQTASNLTWATSAGTYTFNGNVTFQGNSSSTGTYTIDNSAGANFIFKGNVTLTNGTSTLNWTKGTGTITFAKASGTQTAGFLGKTVEDIVVGDGSTTNTLQLTTNGVVTDGITVNTNATLDANSQAINYTAASGTTNNGTIKLTGAETIGANVSNFDTDSGTVIYTGRNIAENLSIKAIPYYNLTITDANTNKATFQTQDGTAQTIYGNFTLSSGTGTFDNSTYDEAINVTGNVTMDNTTVSMGDATWTVSGDFDNADVGTFNKDLSTLIMDGGTVPSPKSITSNAKYLHNIIISGCVAVSAASGIVANSGGTVTVSGVLTIPAGEIFRIYQVGAVLYNTGTITGDGALQLYTRSSIVQQAGTIDVATLDLTYGNDLIAAGTYGSGTVNITNQTTSNRSVIFGSGDIVFTGNVLLDNTRDGYSFTINNSNNPNLTFKGNVTFQQTAGTLNWTPGTGTITLAGTGDQSIDFLDKTVEAINVTNTSGTVTFSNHGFTSPSLTASPGSSISLASTKTFNLTDLTLSGTADDGITLSSTTEDSASLLNVSGTPTLSYLTVSDSDASGGNLLTALNSTDGGGNTNWCFPSYYTITAVPSSSPSDTPSTTVTTTPGSSITATITMKDTSGNTASYSGDVSLTFSGLNTSSNNWIPTATDKTDTATQFGSSTTVTLTNGVGTTTITPYKTEVSTITATDTNSLTTTTPLALTVSRPTVSVSINTPPAAEASGGLSANPTPMPSDKYLASPNITAKVTLSNTNGTTTSGSSIPSYRLAESSAALSSATPQTFTANPLLHITYNLEPTSGYHTLYGTATDTYGNTTATTSSQTVQLDAAAPTTIGNLQAINVSDTTSPEKIYATALVFTPSTDDGSGLLGYAISKDGTLLEPQTNPSYTSPYEGEAGWGQTITNPNTIQQTTDKDNKLGNGSGTEYRFYIDTTNKENTKYTYTITSIDNAGNVSDATTIDEQGKVTTTTTTTLTQISDLTVEFAQSSSSVSASESTPNPSPAGEPQTSDQSITAIVSFTTDAPATSSVSYGTDQNNLTNTVSLSGTVSSAPNSQPQAPNYNTSHTLTITDLNPDTTYYFQATATDQNKHEVTATSSSTSPSIKEDQTLFETIWSKIEGFFSTIWHTIRDLFTGNLASLNNRLDRLASALRISSAYAASSDTTITSLHVSPAYDKNNKFIGKAIYWSPSTDVNTTYIIKRDGTTLATATNNNYLDLTASEDTNNTYQAGTTTGKITETIPGGTPEITDLSINAIAITESSVNIEVSWLTSGVPSSSKVSYGTISGSYDQTTTKETLDESHKVIINNLDPQATYYFQASSTSNTQETSVSQETSYTVPETQKAKSIFVVIYEALADAFGGFIKWLYR